MKLAQKKLTMTAVAGVVAAGVALAAANAASDDTSSNSNGCKVVHLKPGENPPTGMSTSITAGNGQVSGRTTMGNSGNGVSVSSGSGSSATSGAASNSVSTSSNGKTTTVTTSDGNCTVYMRDEK